MKIGIDMDGTITHAPDFFRLLTAALHGRPDVEIHLVSARGHEALAALGRGERGPVTN